MKNKSKKRSFAELEAENAAFLEEVLVARRASEITARLVTPQQKRSPGDVSEVGFVKTDPVARSALFYRGIRNGAVFFENP